MAEEEEDEERVARSRAKEARAAATRPIAGSDWTEKRLGLGAGVDRGIGRWRVPLPRGAGHPRGNRNYSCAEECWAPSGSWRGAFQNMLCFFFILVGG